MATKASILAAYREQVATYPWAQSDPAKLERFMAAARNTAFGLPGDQVDHHGHSWKRALELNGIFGRNQTLKAVRALPDA